MEKEVDVVMILLVNIIYYIYLNTKYKTILFQITQNIPFDLMI